MTQTHYFLISIKLGSNKLYYIIFNAFLIFKLFLQIILFVYMKKQF